MKSIKKNTRICFFVLVTFLLFNSVVYSADPQYNQNNQNNRAERANVDMLKKKYWATGDENDLQVVQNRKFSKAGKFFIGGYIGTIASDPFLTINNAGARVGYYINETFGLSALIWKDFVYNSSAVADLAKQGVAPNTNIPNLFEGAEADFSPIYGKLSLLGYAIVYYDLQLFAGAGVTNTESGSNFTPYLGIGQKFWINKYLALGVEYRLMRYNETVLNKNVAPPFPAFGTRTNYTNAITLGLDFLFNFM